MELGGLIPGSQYDKIIVTGELVLGGLLDVVLINDFRPQGGNRFDLFDGRTSGVFNSVSLPPLGSGLSWDTNGLYTQGVITVVPEPGTLVLLLLAVASGVAWASVIRRRRHDRNAP